MDGVFSLLSNALKDHVSLLLLLIIVSFIITHLDKITNFYNQFKSPAIPPYIKLDDSTYALQKLREYELSKAFESRGMSFMESQTLEKVCCLHNLLAGKLDIKQISWAHKFIVLDEYNKYSVVIPSKQSFKQVILYIIVFYLIFVGIAITYYIQIAPIVKVNDYIIIFSFDMVLLYWIFLFMKLMRPIHSARKLEKLINEKDFFFSTKK